jgi:hypothetical protein
LVGPWFLEVEADRGYGWEPEPPAWPDHLGNVTVYVASQGPVWIRARVATEVKRDIEGNYRYAQAWSPALRFDPGSPDPEPRDRPRAAP